MSLNLTSTVVFTMDLAGCEILLAFVTNPSFGIIIIPALNQN